MEKCLTEINNGFRLLILTNSLIATTILRRPQHLHLHMHRMINRQHRNLTLTAFSISISIYRSRFHSATHQWNWTRDNIDLVHSLHDCNKLIGGRYLPKIRQLLNVLSQYGGDQRTTKRLIDWRVQLDDAKRKFDDFHDWTTNRIFRVVPVQLSTRMMAISEVVPEKEEAFRRIRSSTHRLMFLLIFVIGPRKMLENPKHQRKQAPVVFLKEMQSENRQSEEISSSIPILPYGMDLKYWEEKKEKPTIVRSNADCHRFWRPPDEDAVQCSDMEAEAYNLRVMAYTGESLAGRTRMQSSVDWQRIGQ